MNNDGEWFTKEGREQITVGLIICLTIIAIVALIVLS
jgi:hypothetical protein